MVGKYGANFFGYTDDEDNKFVDRSEIRTLIINEIEHKIQKTDYFKVISIYGMGGIGKSCLLNEIKNQVSRLDKAYRFLTISFEIENNRQYIENLIKICDAYDKPCILFPMQQCYIGKKRVFCS